MSKESVFTPRNKEFFECDCYGKNHLIRAEYDVDEWIHKDGTKHAFRELTIVFTTSAADYNMTYKSGFVGWLKRMSWRIKSSFKILFTGEIETDGYFLPCRSWVNQKENPVEGEFGYQTTKNLAKWLDTTADKIKADYEQDLADLNKKLSEKS